MNITLEHLRSTLEETTFERWGLDELNDYVSDFLGFKVKFENLETHGIDYRVGVSLLLQDDTLAYVDVYYAKDRENNMFITEIGFDSDNFLNNADFEKTIKGVVG